MSSPSLSTILRNHVSLSISSLTYLWDQLTVARDLLTDSGSIFVQIGEENIYRVRVLLDEIFGERNFVAQITFRVKSPSRFLT